MKFCYLNTQFFIFARTVSEICVTCTNVTKQVPGVIRYNEINTGEMERDDLVGRDFRYVNIAIKKHINGHMHSDHV